MGKVKDIKDDRVTIESGSCTLVRRTGPHRPGRRPDCPRSRHMSLLDLHLLGSPVLREESSRWPWWTTRSAA